MRQHTLTRYFAQGVGPYVNEEWCMDGLVHLFRRAVDLPFGGGWQALGVVEIGPCDGKKCKIFTTSNGVEERSEPIDPGCINIYNEETLPPEFRNPPRDTEEKLVEKLKSKTLAIF